MTTSAEHGPRAILQMGMTAKLTHFSFSTLTTIGFGDVTPLHPFARSLATAEAFVGQLFHAILIGAPVAMALQTHSKS
ncbi:MAG TPA: potassium channel family protein [Candidatus Acidoferrum sp.]|nr:potassium channel family protein [Candidatus Acidoferrum sp.]